VYEPRRITNRLSTTASGVAPVWNDVVTFRERWISRGSGVRMMSLSELSEPLARDGFAFIHAPRMRAVLETAGLTDWEGLAATWNDLGVDTFMADGGRYRRRRFAAFAASPSGIERKPHQPHYQSRDYNALNGGVARWFSPVTGRGGIAPRDARHPRHVPSTLRCAHARVDAPPRLACRSTSIPESRPAPSKACPPPRECIATAWTGARHAGAPREHRERRDDDGGRRASPARELHAHRARWIPRWSTTIACSTA